MSAGGYGHVPLPVIKGELSLLWFHFYLTLEKPPPATTTPTTPTQLHFKSVIMSGVSCVS
jgi:hypothetical protein